MSENVGQSPIAKAMTAKSIVNNFISIYENKLAENVLNSTSCKNLMSKVCYDEVISKIWMRFHVICKKRSSDKKINVISLMVIVDKLNLLSKVTAIKLNVYFSLEILKKDWFLIVLKTGAEDVFEMYNDYIKNKRLFCSIYSKSYTLLKLI